MKGQCAMTQAKHNFLPKLLLAAVCSVVFVCAMIALGGTKASAVSISSCTVQSISAKTYTGSQIKPVPYVKYNGKTLKRNTDYTISYKSNINAGTAYVIITGKGKYSGTVKRAFTIKPALIYSATFYKIGTKYYTGSEIKPVPKIVFGGKTLKNNKDFTLRYTANTNIGTAKVYITGKGNFNGSCSLSFGITARPLSSCSVSVAAATYTGSALKPTVTVKTGSYKFKSGTDYTVTYKNNVNAGTATAVIKGKNHLSGSRTVTFRISGKSLSSAVASYSKSATYTGKSIKPSVTVKLSGKALKLNTDYTVTYKNNIDAGTATITIKGKGNYSGTLTKSFTIKPRSITAASFGSIADKPFTGAAIKPSPAINYNSAELENGKDFTLSYSDNTSIGQATVTVNGKGNFTGSKALYFNITQRSASTLTVTAKNAVYSGSELKPTVTVKYGSYTFTKDEDYTVAYKDNINPGTATVVITGKNRLNGSQSATFEISKQSVSGATVTISSEYTFSGEAFTPEPTVVCCGKTLTKDVDYTLAYSDNINAGNAYITITGMGNYTDSLKKSFKIAPAQLKNVVFTTAAQYKPSGVTADISAVLGGYTLCADDYEISLPTAAGTHSATATGKGNFSGTTQLSIYVAPADISKAKVQLVMPEIGKGYDVSVTYDGYTLRKDSDFTVKSVDTFLSISVQITGKGNYTGVLAAQFDTAAAELFGKVKVSEIADVTYSGDVQRPAVTVTTDNGTLTENKDYTVQYENNINAGTATAKIIGINTYAGMEKYAYFNILKANLSSCKAVCDTQYYTGSALKPIPTVTYGGYTLVNTTDFKVSSYASNVNIGTGKIGIIGIGNFSGTLSVEFTIKYSNAEEDAVRKRLDEMMQGLWDRKINSYMHSYKLGNYFNTTLTSPCTCHSFCETGYESGCTCLIGRSTVLNNTGIQCCGFTLEVFEYLFGKTNGAGENTLDIFSRAANSWTADNIKKWMSGFKAGDYLAYDNIAYGYPHYVIIYAVEDDGIWVYEANYGGRCKINFRKMTYSDIYSQLDDMWHRTPNNYELSIY